MGMSEAQPWTQLEIHRDGVVVILQRREQGNATWVTTLTILSRGAEN